MQKCMRVCVRAWAVKGGCQSCILIGGKWKPMDDELARTSHDGNSGRAHLKISAWVSFIEGAMLGFSALRVRGSEILIGRLRGGG